MSSNDEYNRRIEEANREILARAKEAKLKLKEIEPTAEKIQNIKHQLTKAVLRLGVGFERDVFLEDPIARQFVRDPSPVHTDPKYDDGNRECPYYVWELEKYAREMGEAQESGHLNRVTFSVDAGKDMDPQSMAYLWNAIASATQADADKIIDPDLPLKEIRHLFVFEDDIPLDNKKRRYYRDNSGKTVSGVLSYDEKGQPKVEVTQKTNFGKDREISLVFQIHNYPLDDSAQENFTQTEEFSKGLAVEAEKHPVRSFFRKMGF